ncbi:MAG TPA: ATP-binding protein [Candidatus Paceibacterota bacterium]|nr:ATP-binding protein [Candidatus Paceibacterota bacterium]
MDEDLPRRKNILNVLLVGSVLMLSTLDAFVLFHSVQDGAAYHDVPFAAFSVLPAFFILLYVLSRRGSPRVVSFLFVGAYFVSNSYAAYRYGVGMQVVLIAYALIIVMATILRGTQFGFATTGAVAAFIIPLWYAQIHGIVATQVPRPTADDAIVFSVLYLLIMTVAWLYEREVHRSLRRAHDSEKALREERDLLEVKVGERTEELRRTQLEKMQQLNRLAELGQLSSGLFHDLLNLLNALSLRNDDEEDPSLASARNTARQIEGFMQAVRKQIGNADARESFSLKEAIGHAVQLVNHKANKEGVRIGLSHIPKMDIRYFGVPYKFQEVIINLLFNAIESYEQLPQKDVRLRHVNISMEEHDGMAALRVEDNGCGMTPAVADKIFEPFFTTKEAHKGIGIGLATVQKIIKEELGGTISVASTPAAGSTFTVTFPIRHESDARHHNLQRAPAHPKMPIP